MLSISASLSRKPPLTGWRCLRQLWMRVGSFSLVSKDRKNLDPWYFDAINKSSLTNNRLFSKGLTPHPIPLKLRREAKSQPPVASRRDGRLNWSWTPSRRVSPMDGFRKTSALRRWMSSSAAVAGGSINFPRPARTDRRSFLTGRVRRSQRLCGARMEVSRWCLSEGERKRTV